VSVAEWRAEVDVCAGVQEGDGDFGIAEPAGDAERSLARVVDGAAGCEGRSVDVVI
jgi:hypothetical protein